MTDLITAPVSIDKGGTGATTARAVDYMINGNMNQATSAVTDSTNIVMRYVTPDETQGTMYYSKASLLKDYILSAIPSGCSIKTGSYTGTLNNDTYDTETTTTKFVYTSKSAIKQYGRQISLGVTPKILFLQNNTNTIYGSSYLKLGIPFFPSCTLTQEAAYYQYLGNSSGWSTYAGYTAYLSGNILYVGHTWFSSNGYLTYAQNGFNYQGITYNWVAIY